MEYNERIVKEQAPETYIFPHEYEQASNSYLMAVVSVIAGIPLPIINLIAAIGFYLGHRKSTYFVRWHCIQSIIGQALLIPFNSIAFGWTIGVIFGNREASTAYWIYIITILWFNIFEFIVVLYTASKVRNGHNIRWFLYCRYN
jgi:uncharacterized membrane protein